MNNNKMLFLGAAAAGLMLAAGCQAADKKATPDHQAAKVEGECHGVNACKGTGECGGKGHSCAGKNACKGKGWVKMSKAKCEAKGGSFKG